MDPKTFRQLYDDIVVLNATEGPRQNVLEPKFTARAQLETLITTIRNAYAENGSLEGMRQLSRCLVLKGTNMMETDEDAEGVKVLQQAYTIVSAGCVERVLEDVGTVEPTPLNAIIELKAPLASVEHQYAFVAEFMRTLNAVGIFLSNREATQPVNDAKHVLHVAEVAYIEWDAWFLEKPTSCTMKDISVNDNGSLKTDTIPDGLQDIYQQRFDMDVAYTSTIFFLAQVYTTLQQPHSAARYCHYTLYYQLLSKQEFSKKAWATNALQLSEYYTSKQEYGKALHCLNAGKSIMPMEDADDETAGLVGWVFGRFYLDLLEWYGQKHLGADDAKTTVGPQPVELSWWLDFPIDIPAPSPLPPITTFEEARETFKSANSCFQEALKFYPFDGRCTDHIKIQQDITRLYAALIVFEADRDRIAAMHQRRAALLENFPDELSFNAYPTLIRQLLFDLGGIYEELLDLRIQQRREPRAGEKPLSEKQINVLTDKTIDFFYRFCETWRDPIKHHIPTTLDEESRLPYFRALMRRAQLQTKHIRKNPKDEYDDLGNSAKAFDEVIAFSRANPLGEEAVHEAKLAEEMAALLPLKQRELWRAYSKVVQ